MNKKQLLLPVLFLLFTQIIFSQTIAKNKNDEISPELSKEIFVFLRETSVEVNNLQSLENRISFAAELASLMWFQDEKEARVMFQTVINDFRQLLVNYDAQINALGITPTEGSFMMPDESSSAQISRKFMKAVTMRQQIATAISEHDAQLALDFFTSTGQVISNPEFRKQIDERDAFFETRLLQQIAENDPATALKFARKTLEKGINYETISLLQKIYDKDADKGAEFGQDILAALKSNSTNQIDLINSILNVGAENFNKMKGKPKTRPMFSEMALRELAELLAQQILKRPEDDNNFEGFLPNIEKFAPARAMQIRQKFKIKPAKKETKTASVESVSVETEKLEEDSSEKMLENLQNLGDQKLSKEEREKVVANARKEISAIKEPVQKLFALSALASQVSASGDKQLASEIMDEARSFVNFQPKNYMDFMKIWLLASGYSKVDAQKAFPLIEDAVFRINDLIAALFKIGEFIDVNGEFIEDGEAQVGGFGGEISREITRNIGAMDNTIKNLAVADFARTKALTNKFDRQEVRILAKMLVLRSVFGNKAAVVNSEGETTSVSSEEQ